MANETPYIPLGVIGDEYSTGLFVRTDSRKSQFKILWNNTRGSETQRLSDVEIINEDGKKENPAFCHTFSFADHPSICTATYIRESKDNKERVIATSVDLLSWNVISVLPLTSPHALITSTSKHNFTMLTDGAFIKYATSKYLKSWEAGHKLIMTSRNGFFDQGPINLLGAYHTTDGLMVLYDTTEHHQDHVVLQIGGVLLDNNDPTHILWRPEHSLWKATLKNTSARIKTLGTIIQKETIVVYWISDEGMILNTTLEAPLRRDTKSTFPHKISLKKFHKNPVISPREHHEWTHGGTFNPAAFQDSEGKIHIIYRAVGADGVSRFGYAGSRNGMHFDDHVNHPVFSLQKPSSSVDPKDRYYNPVMFPSGGSWGGCEDPRMVQIGKKIYVTFSAFDDWDCIRIGLTTISEKNFLEKKWKWSKPLLISPFKKVNKNWVLFPEKIDGKFAILHSVSPEVEIDYVESLEDLANGKKIITSKLGKGKPRQSWDTHVRGAGPPPLKTPEGWLVLYHAINKREPHKYKLGALLLDLKNPKKVIARAPAPLIEPHLWYENDWKEGVVYACGAVIDDDTLYVYYGGGDKHICVATGSVSHLLEHIKKDLAFSLSTEHVIN